MQNGVQIKSEVDMKFWDNLIARSEELNMIEVEAGYYPDTIHKDSGLSLGDLATIMCKGSVKRNILPRDFMLQGLIYWSEYDKVFTKAFIDFCFRKKTLNESMTPVGRLGMRSIQKAVMSQRFTPLKPETIAKKGNSTILVDTGELLNAPVWKVGMANSLL